MSCATPLTFDVQMGPEGVVKQVVLIDPKAFEAGDPCQAAADLAQRAIWKSSPLPVPNGSQHLKLSFDSSDFH